MENNNILGRVSNRCSAIILDPPCTNTAASFNEHFINLGNIESNVSDKSLEYLNQPPTYSVFMPPTNYTEVMNQLKALKSESPGFDEISPKVIKFTSELLAIPLTYIINLSIKQGIFPHH